MFVEPIVHPAKGVHSATVIFFHGLGDRADNLVQWLRYLLGRDLLGSTPQQPHQFGHIKVIFPSAPRQKFTLFGGRPSNVWFDVYGTQANIGLPERREGFRLIDRIVGDLIDAEVRAGIDVGRIVVGGFSMGGYMALHTALRLSPGVAGCFCLSSYLNYDNAVFDALAESNDGAGGHQPPAKRRPPLLMIHGDRDELLPHRWGRITFDELTRLGVPGTFHTVVDMKHEMRADEMLQLERWLGELLPPVKERRLKNKL